MLWVHFFSFIMIKTPRALVGLVSFGILIVKKLNIVYSNFYNKNSTYWSYFSTALCIHQQYETEILEWHYDVKYCDQHQLYICYYYTYKWYIKSTFVDEEINTLTSHNTIYTIKRKWSIWNDVHYYASTLLSVTRGISKKLLC